MGALTRIVKRMVFGAQAQGQGPHPKGKGKKGKPKGKGAKNGALELARRKARREEGRGSCVRGKKRRSLGANFEGDIGLACNAPAPFSRGGRACRQRRSVHAEGTLALSTHKALEAGAPMSSCQSASSAAKPPCGDYEFDGAGSLEGLRSPLATAGTKLNCCAVGMRLQVWRPLMPGGIQCRALRRVQVLRQLGPLHLKAMRVGLVFRRRRRT